MAYQVTLRMQNGVERDVACYGYECHIAHSDRPDIGRIIAAHMEVCQKLGTADYLPVEEDLIALTFESTDHDNFFYEWLLQGNMANGEIEFATGDDIVDIFRFWDCYCVSLKETLCTGEMPMLMTVLLSPGILKRMNCEPREKVWKVSDISVKPRVVDNDETHNSEPMVLVTSVKGKNKAIVSQTVQYVVTKYNVPNVKDSDRKRVKWVIEVDGQKEYLKEQGETLDLQIKEEWEGKEIIVMPYLKQCTYNVSVHTKVERWYLPRVIVQTKTKEGFGTKNDRKIFEYEDAFGKGLTPSSKQIAVDMHWGNGKTHTNNFNLEQIKDKEVLKNIQLLKLKSDQELFNMLRNLVELTSRGKLEAQNLEIINHLEQRNNSEYSNEVLTNEVFNRKITQEFLTTIRTGFYDGIKEKKGNLNLVRFNKLLNTIERPKFSFGDDKLRGLTIAINDIWGFRVTLESYSFNFSKKECIAVIRYRLFDHFGLDIDDIESYGTKEKILFKMGVPGSILEAITIPFDHQGQPLRNSGVASTIANQVANGFCAWFILQHLRGYKPFVTAMERRERIKFNI